MELLCVGLSHKTAPIEVRESVYFQGEELRTALESLRRLPNFTEVSLLSTCNRTEIYAVTDLPSGSAEVSSDILADFLLRRAGGKFSTIVSRSFTNFESSKMVRHLLAVASGIESMVLGEGQILGQVREAGEIARLSKTSGPILNSLFNQAVSAGKRARSETGITRRPVSIAHVAVDVARQIFEGLAHRSVLLIGAGKMSQVAVRYLHQHGVEKIWVANRTKERAEAVARELGADPLAWEELTNGLIAADLVVTSTASENFILDRPILRRVQLERGERPLVIMDIAVPRDVDPAVRELGNVFLYNLDDLQKVVDQNLREREEELPQVMEIIEEEEAAFFKWLAGRSIFREVDAVPLTV